jgi:hypothetical protein
MKTNKIEAQTVEQRIANMDAFTARGVMDMISKRRMNLAITRYQDSPDQYLAYAKNDDKLGRLQTKLLERVLESPLTSLDIQRKSARESFFR